MASPYRQFVEQTAQLYRTASAWADDAGTQPDVPDLAHPAPTDDAPCAVIFSPHPDDECLTGGWPLRLRHEAGWRVVNVAVTLGSNPDRRPDRARELQNACRHLGFGLYTPDGQGLENIRLQTRRDRPDYWTYAVNTIASLLQELQPRLVLLPHASDAHPTHIGTHALVRHALIRARDTVRCHVAESEYWAPQENPNLLVELPTETVALLTEALALHVGEVARNPYHLRLPAWLMDNVRRGAELLGGPGSAAPNLIFGILYHLRQWDGHAYHSPAQPITLTQADAPDAALGQWA